MTHRSASTPFPIRLILLLLLVASAGYIARVAITVAAPGIKLEFGLSDTQVGSIFSAFLAGYTLFQIPSGLLADRRNPRGIFLVLSLAWAVLSVATAIVGWRNFALALALPQLWVIRGALGVLSAPIYPTSGRIVAVTTPQHLQARAGSLIFASIGVGSAFTPLVLSPMNERWGWRSSLLLAAALCATAFLFWYFLSPQRLPLLTFAPQKESATTPSPSETPDPLRSPSYWFLCASYFLQGYLGYIFIFWFYLYLVQVRHMKVLEAAGFTALPWLATMFAIPLGGILSDLAVTRWGSTLGRRILPLSALFLSGAFLVIGARTASPLLAVAALTGSTVFVLATEGPFWATMTQLAGPRSGTAGGVMNFCSNLGGIISPTLTPWLAQRIGWESALTLTAGLALIAALFWLLVKAGSVKKPVLVASAE